MGRAALRTEVTTLASMDHPNIIKLYEFYDLGNVFALVTEICNGGDLFNQIA